MRKVIVHYHIFKNAGTSVDRMLAQSFGERWQSWDSNDPGNKISAAELETFILDHPDLLAVSSHQAVPPLPNKHLQVFPIIFIRHPIDRAYSAYLFEWKKQQGTDQPKGLFKDYIKEKFSHKRKNAIEDFQTFHLANRGYNNKYPSAELDDEEILRNAKNFLMSIPTFGIVENYEISMKLFKYFFIESFPELTFNIFEDNIMQNKNLSIYEKVRNLKNSLDFDTFNQLILRNQLDIRLYEFASTHINLLNKFTENS